MKTHPRLFTADVDEPFEQNGIPRTWPARINVSAQTTPVRAEPA